MNLLSIFVFPHLETSKCGFSVQKGSVGKLLRWWIPAGEYKVTITADVFTKAKKGAPDDDSTLFAGTLVHIVPPEYNELNTTPLKQKVEKSRGKQEFIFDIPSKAKKK